MSAEQQTQTNDADEPKYPLAEENGDWTVDLTSEGTFGASLTHDLGHNVIFMALPYNAGWHTMGECFTMLSGQTYAKKVEAFFEENGTSFRKISIVSLETGDWQTVWETKQKWRLDD